MSYILEALRRADQERQLNSASVPDLRISHEPVARPSQRRWWLLGATLLAVNLAIVALLAPRMGAQDVAQTSDDGAAPPRIAPAEAGPSRASSETVTQPVRPRETVPDAPHESVLGPPVSATRAVPPDLQPSAVQPEPLPLAAADRPSGEPVPPHTVLPRQAPPPPREKGRSAPRTADSQGVPAAPSPMADPANLPEWRDLPVVQRDRFERPRLDVHVYDVDPARRMVLIELKRYREGDTLPGGALLEQIDPDGIVLEQSGVRYHVPRR
jgi:general secretion pathway protein B